MLCSSALRRSTASTGAAILAAVAVSAPAQAQDLVLEGCEGFEVGVTFVDSHGNPPQAGPRRVLQAGTQTITLTNESSGTETTVRTAGAVTRAVFNAEDGSTTYTFTGRTVQVLFPTDPGGPSSTLYSGHLIANQGADGTTTPLSAAGSSVDLCATLTD